MLRGVTKRYGSSLAVRDLSLEVLPGEFLTLLGPSGSGKTTTLMMIAGFVDADAGDIEVGGRSLAGVPPHRRELGVVFQHYLLFPHLTVARNVGFPLEVRRVPRREAERRVRDVLELVQLPDVEHRYPRQLSGGQQQRIALARALVYDPPVLLMDEPLGALDRKLREEMQLELKAIQRRLGITVIYVTHDQDEALTMSDRIAVMRDGRIEQLGPGAELYERPVSRFVAGFLGDTNFLEGTAVTGGVVLATGLRVGTATGDAPSGARVVVALRPEKLTFAEAGRGTTGEATVVEGVVENVVYVGDLTKYHVRVPAAGAVLLVERQNRSGPEAVRGGDTVWIEWSNGDARVLPGEGDS